MMLVGPHDECTAEIRLDGTFQAWVNSLLLFVQRIQLCVKDVVPKKNPVQNCCVKDGCSKDKSRSKLKKTYINIGLQSGLGTVKKWVGNKILFDIVEPA